MFDLFIGLGSNLGDRDRNIRDAIARLSDHDLVDFVALSQFYETEPVNAVGHPMYINAAAKFSSILSPREFMEFAERVERDLGRDSKGNYDPRTVDIDLLLYGTDIVSDEDLIVPHPLLHEREFVLRPMMDIAPEAIHPLLEMSIKELFDALAR
ncbi:MAG: 2-amino-4-hydroxy-6-hydroxymethyldihydropteridine diphosphokinase [bacterium]|nr:2-amino-4-hydroxy-6-hydroxymethyldihydropteridine diphosphokinase [bacterium]